MGEGPFILVSGMGPEDALGNIYTCMHIHTHAHTHTHTHAYTHADPYK